MRYKSLGLAPTPKAQNIILKNVQTRHVSDVDLIGLFTSSVLGKFSSLCKAVKHHTKRLANSLLFSQR